ncbi:MAG TPA: cytochrome c maturation protein CcmE [Fimbriimonas sp.]|nr:cytochrome c maturation protein CcmE [Fimbriimonas sp.]
MKLTAIVPVVVSFAAIAVSVAVFQTGATPYLTVNEARKLSGDRLNLGVEIDKATIKRDIKNHVLEFEGKDKDGVSIKIKHVGDIVDLSKAERVTCIGKMEGDTFVSQQMLVKCPSKYEEEQAAKGKSSK